MAERAWNQSVRTSLKRSSEGSYRSSSIRIGPSSRPSATSEGCDLGTLTATRAAWAWFAIPKSRPGQAMEFLFESVKDEEFYAALVRLREATLKEGAQ